MVDSVGRAGQVRNRDGQRCWQDDFAVVPHMKLPLHTHLTASRYGEVPLQGESAAIFGQLQAGGLGVEGDGDVLFHPAKLIAGRFGNGSGFRRLTIMITFRGAKSQLSSTSTATSIAPPSCELIMSVSARWPGSMRRN